MCHRGVYDRCVTDKREGYRGRCTAPLLIDMKAMRIVSNESSQIMRNLNEIEWPEGTGIDLRPAERLKEIEELNERVRHLPLSFQKKCDQQIYENVNNGVYKCGFATSQSAYDAASNALFSELHRLDKQLAASRFLLGDKCELSQV